MACVAAAGVSSVARVTAAGAAVAKRGMPHRQTAAMAPSLNR
jgi:hypothetical protein